MFIGSLNDYNYTENGRNEYSSDAEEVAIATETFFRISPITLG